MRTRQRKRNGFELGFLNSGDEGENKNTVASLKKIITVTSKHWNVTFLFHGDNVLTSITYFDLSQTNFGACMQIR